MQVSVRLFAVLRERAGAGEIELELPEGASVADALEKVQSLTEGVPVVMAVNREYADASASLAPGDELALIPPVSGGSVGSPHARVTDEPLELEPLLERVRDPRAGAVVTFHGVTREVPELDYEAYAPMAERRIAEIVAAAIERHGLCAAAAEHRVGVVPLSEPSVLVAVSAPHRDAAFAGAREIIDEIKSQAPIWKKEEGEWVGRAGASELRDLPSVHELAGVLGGPHVVAVSAARRAIEERRAAVRAGADPDRDVVSRAREILAGFDRPSLRRVLNATGVIVHTNLGRAPLAASARDAVAQLAEGYSNLELELESGARGSRQTHIALLLSELTGAEDAIAVNNGAGAVLLAAAALAGPDHAIVVSRGQLVEIGGGFRIPEVIAQSGATLVEVGTTNRTRVPDYERAIATSQTPVGAILRVHPSNFRSLGFVEDVSIEQLCNLGVPVIDDVGSGVLADANGIPELSDEPSLRRSVAAGASLVCCSGDKLLGGPQAGLLLGRSQAVAAARQHPLARALRIDKLSLAALEATLMLYRDPERARREIPVLTMLDAGEETLTRRAQQLRASIGEEHCRIVRAVGRVGGGALPLLELEGPVVAIRSEVEPAALGAALRFGDPPLVARIHDGQLLLDPRTLADDELQAAAGAVRSALQQR